MNGGSVLPDGRIARVPPGKPPAEPEPVYPCPTGGHTTAGATRIGLLAVCVTCGRSLAWDGSGYRFATAADTRDLDENTLTALRAARGRAK